MICGAILISSCKDSYNRATDIIEELEESAYVISEQYTGNSPRLITVNKIEENNKEYYQITIHNLENSSKEIINCSFKPVEVLKNSNGHLVISEFINPETTKRKNYCIENIPKKGKPTIIRLDEDNQTVFPTAYVVDNISRHITLTCLFKNCEKAKEYYVKLNFDGEKILNDSQILNLRPTRKSMYLWVCSTCGATANNTSSISPAIPYTKCKRKSDGTFMAHRMSNHGRVD